jgi:hypothetical protein
VHLVGGAAGVDPAPARRIRLGEPRVRVADLLLERAALALEAVGVATAGGGLVEIELEQERDVRLEAAGGEAVHARDLVHPQPARAALVGERRVEVAVGHDDLALLERRPDRLRDELGAGRREQQRLGARADLERRVLQHVAKALADGRAARLAHGHGALAEGVAQELGLGRLARPVHALEGHEQPTHIRGRRYQQGRRPLEWPASCGRW